MYLERLNRFADSNPYYVYGGKFYRCSEENKLPNCTEYLVLRIWESTETVAPYQLFEGKSATGYPIAKEFFDDTILPKGYELRDGCGAVFDGSYGHVCYVERMIDSNHAIITESQYDDDKTLRNYKYWNRRTVELTVGKATLSGVGKLIGFIYPDINDKRVQRNSNEQVRITEDFVNVRREPEGQLTNEGCFCPLGLYNVLDSEEVNGFVWYKLDTECWVREGSWLEHYDPSGELERLIKENAELKAKLKRIEDICNE